MEAAVGRRLDRLARHLERVERHVTISNEALALFGRFWLTATPLYRTRCNLPLKRKGRERYQGFAEVLGRRLAKGQSLAKEVSLDVEPGGRQSEKPDSS